MSVFWSMWMACLSPDIEPSPAPQPPSPEEAPNAPSPERPSIYELSVPLTASSGLPVSLDVHRGHPTLLSMFYASCRSACPMLVGTVKTFESSLDEASRARLRVLLVSLDPQRDRPEALAEAAERYGADPERWVLAVPPEDRVREVAAVLGVQYRPAADGEMLHSSVLVLLDAQGREIARSDGPDGSTDALRAALLASTD